MFTLEIVDPHADCLNIKKHVNFKKWNLGSKQNFNILMIYIWVTF